MEEGIVRAKANRKAQSARIKRKVDVLRRYFGIDLIKGDNSKISREVRAAFRSDMAAYRDKLVWL